MARERAREWALQNAWFKLLPGGKQQATDPRQDEDREELAARAYLAGMQAEREKRQLIVPFGAKVFIQQTAGGGIVIRYEPLPEH